MNMTVGDKIRYIRGLRNMTQKELGVLSGFSSATADVRIRQYESNKMIPKADKLANIAKALNVDVSALSNVNITSKREAMQILFEFEKIWGISLKKDNKSFSLTFDNLEKKDSEMFFFLDSWYEAKRIHELKIQASDDYENHLKYLMWKSRFPLDMQEREQEMNVRLSEKFSPIKDTVIKDYSPLETAKDFALLLESMIRNNIHMCFSYILNGVGDGISIISFSDSILLNLGLDESKLYAKFLCSMDTLTNAEILITEQKHTYESNTFSDFLIHSSPLASLISSLKELRKHIDEGTEDDYKCEYEDTLQIYNIAIKDIL